MRSIVLTLGVLIALAGGFAAFMMTQPKSTPTTKKGGDFDAMRLPDPPSTNTAVESPIGRGEGIWITRYNRETGDLEMEFLADEYDPPKDGVVHVNNAKARFYTRDGQVLAVEARQGDVVMPEQAKKSDKIGSLQTEPPTRGMLYDVTLKFFDDDIETTPPSLTCKVPVVAFDNDTMRLHTVQTVIDGKDVLADRVPVTVRGRDYDFDGEGLSLRWNQRDQRLESLEIAHGKRLTVKNTKAFGNLPLPGAQSRRPVRDQFIELAATDAEEAARLAAEERERRRQKRLAQERRAAATQRAAAATQQNRRPVAIAAYRATFHGDVVIMEGQRQIGSADQMIAVFTFENDDAVAASTQPANEPATLPAVTQPTTRRARSQAATGPAATRPAAPATQPQPLEIRWSGKLTILPTTLADSGLASVTDRVVEFVGNPVKLDREGTQVEAVKISAAASGERFSARGSEALPQITLKDPSGMLLKTNSIDIVGDVATLTGKSTAELTLADKEKPGKLLTSWTDKGTLRLTTGADGKRGIESAKFEGAVDVAHPQLKLKSKSLSLAFDPSAKQQPALKTCDARGDVTATITGEDGQAQTISAQSLVTGMDVQPNGELAFRTLSAAGDVVLQSPAQKLTADRVEVLVKAPPAPVAGATTKPSSAEMQIDKLVADGKVTFKTEDDVNATADVLSIETRDDKHEITLHGAPASMRNRDSSLSGNLIKLASDGSTASVVGAGSLTGLSKAPGGADARPMKVTWTQSMDFNSVANRVDVVGDVTITSRSSDGSKDTASGKRLQLVLDDAPKKSPANTQPAKQPSTQQPVGKSATALGEKVVKSIRLSEHVEVWSILHADDNAANILRQVLLQAPAIDVTMNPAGELASLAIPSGGKMLYDDRRPPAAMVPPAGVQAAPQQQNVRGAVAIEWGKSMVYDPATNQVVLEGDVKVVHKEVNQDPVSMQSSRLIAELEPAAGKQAQGLKRVRAVGGATFRAKTMSFHAEEAVYDPALERVVANGTQREPVKVFDENDVSTGSFDELWWNLKTNRPERMKNVTGSIRR